MIRRDKITRQAFALIILVSGIDVYADNKATELVRDSSYFHLLIYSAGILRGFSNDSVIAARQWQSDLVMDNGGNLEINLDVDVDSLEVDNEKDRALYDHLANAGQPSPRAVKRTKRIMLGKKVLDVRRYPTVRVQVNVDFNSRNIDVSVEIKGRTARKIVALTLECKDQISRAVGDIHFTHRDFGLRPYSTLLGAIKIAEPLDFHFAAAVPIACKDLSA